MTEPPALRRADWDLPAGVHAFFTTRHGGCSVSPYATFNLGQHVGDAPSAVAANRQQLQGVLGQASAGPVHDIQWLRQVHGTRVYLAGPRLQWPPPEADALHTRAPGLALGILTADCLPVLFCAADGSEVAAAHAGWRGLLGGVLESAIACFRASPDRLSAWLGPAIGPCHFEVGDEVRRAFVAAALPAEVDATRAAFQPAQQPGKWFGSLQALARLRLHRCGVHSVAGNSACTVCDQNSFYSFRAQPVTGRFATLILKSG